MRGPVAVAVTGLVLCLSATALAGCVPGDPVSKSTSPAEPLERHTLVPITDETILGYCPDIPAEHFGGFTSYEVVYICRADEHRATDGTSTYGPWQSAYRVADPRLLLELYALPNADRIDTEACPTGAADPLIVWVHSGGKVHAIYAPVNGCGFARGEMVDVYQKAERDLVDEADTGEALDAHDTPAEH
jgi:hypothetical protein